MTAQNSTNVSQPLSLPLSLPDDPVQLQKLLEDAYSYIRDFHNTSCFVINAWQEHYTKELEKEQEVSDDLRASIDAKEKIIAQKNDTIQRLRNGIKMYRKRTRLLDRSVMKLENHVKRCQQIINGQKNDILHLESKLQQDAASLKHLAHVIDLETHWNEKDEMKDLQLKLQEREEDNTALKHTYDSMIEDFKNKLQERDNAFMSLKQTYENVTNDFHTKLKQKENECMSLTDRMKDIQFKYLQKTDECKSLQSINDIRVNSYKSLTKDLKIKLKEQQDEYMNLKYAYDSLLKEQESKSLAKYDAYTSLKNTYDNLVGDIYHLEAKLQQRDDIYMSLKRTYDSLIEDLNKNKKDANKSLGNTYDLIMKDIERTASNLKKKDADDDTNSDMSLSSSTWDENLNNESGPALKRSSENLEETPVKRRRTILCSSNLPIQHWATIVRRCENCQLSLTLDRELRRKGYLLFRQFLLTFPRKDVKKVLYLKNNLRNEHANQFENYYMMNRELGGELKVIQEDAEYDRNMEYIDSIELENLLDIMDITKEQANELRMKLGRIICRYRGYYDSNAVKKVLAAANGITSSDFRQS